MLLRALHLLFRNIVGIVEPNGRQEFLKMALEPGILNRHIQNEVEILRRLESGDFQLPVSTLRINNAGIYEYHDTKTTKHLAWFISDYLESKEIYPFTPEHPANPEIFETYLQTIVDIAIAIMDWQQELPMPLDVPRQQVAHEVIDKIEFWIHDRLSTPEVAVKAAKAYELYKKFFTNMEELDLVLNTGPSHGDFAPDVFRITPDKKIYLMDLEKVRMQWMKFYDITYMYHRLYTKYKNPELAKTLLQKFITNYSQQHVVDERAV